jgi:hypothetical protein
MANAKRGDVGRHGEQHLTLATHVRDGRPRRYSNFDAAARCGIARVARVATDSRINDNAMRGACTAALR